jgi:hypothetical protein
MVTTPLNFNLDEFYPWALLWLVAFTVFIGFWCASAVKGTTRAILWLCPVLGMVLAAVRVGTAGSGLIGVGFTRWVSYLLPHDLYGQQFAVVALVLPIVFAAAIQSYQLFRVEVQDGNQSLLRRLPALVLVAFLWGLVR